MAKVHMTIREGRKVIKKGSMDFERVVSRLIDLTGGALAPITARATLNEGNTYKYKDKGYNITLTPIYEQEY